MSTALELVSVIAALAAAAAAGFSWRVSRSMTEITRRSVFAQQHRDSAITLAEVLAELIKIERKIAPLEYALDQTLQDALNKYDQRELGGEDPRPLRHVAYDASEFYYVHTSSKESFPSESILAQQVRHGCGAFSDAEHDELLKRADKYRGGFEGVFGAPRSDRPILESMAYRWSLYQLQRRLPGDIGLQAWYTVSQSRAARAFRSYAIELLPIYKDLFQRLEAERMKSAFSEIPLQDTKPLYDAFQSTERVITALADAGSLSLLDDYKAWSHPGDVPALFIYLGAVLRLHQEVGNTLSDLRGKAGDVPQWLYYEELMDASMQQSELPSP